MADVYGERIGQELKDEEWLQDVGERGWVVLMKDARIRRRPAELDVLAAHRVRAFCLTNANLRGADQAQRLVDNLDRIHRIEIVAEEVSAGDLSEKRKRKRAPAAVGMH